MFTTRSAVPQLKPNTIIKCVQVSEDHQWSLGDLASGQDGPQDGPELGSMLLRQGTCLKRLHSFFSQLESRKCCLHLACRRSTFNSIRVVPVEDEGVSSNKQSSSCVSYLDNKNLRTFKNAYMCAVFPVLATPEPPVTPSPAFMDTHVPSKFRLDAGQAISTSGYSSQDSGMEEAEDAAVIPMEMVCEQLRRAFGLTTKLFHQYESLLVKAYARKSPQRILAEELAGQLILLETNSHPYYSPTNFLSQTSYDLWQKQERSHISELLNKFWQYSLPFPVDNQELVTNLSVIHEDYLILLRKLLEYESQFRLDRHVITADIFIPLSSASGRLLLEFAMRYGIGELYRKVILLHCLTNEFSPSIGYLTYINGLAIGILQMLPANKTMVVMVKKELNILSSSIEVLKVQCCKALSQMKLLFIHPAEGIDSLLSLLQTVLQLKEYLAPVDSTKETLTECVTNTVLGMFQRSYDMFKIVALKDLDKCSSADLDPRLLNAVMEDVQEDVVGFKNSFEICFMQFFSISQLAARSFYQFLMADVKELIQHHKQHQKLTQIDLQMLGLVYRLNKLDILWRLYIPARDQVWRGYFLPYCFQWLDALQDHLQKVVLDAVAGDGYRSQQFQLAHPLFTYQKSSTSSERKSCTFSVTSFSPSINSAFSSLASSVDSIPQQSCPFSAEDGSTIVNPSDELEADITEGVVSDADCPVTSDVDPTSLTVENSNPKDLVKFSITSCRSLPDDLHLLGRSGDVIDSKGRLGEVNTDQGRLRTDLVHHSSLDFLDHLDFGSKSTYHEPQPAAFFTPPLVNHDLCFDDQSPVHNWPDSDNSECEDFHFPPLKIISPSTNIESVISSDLSRPVFSKSMSQDSLAQQPGDGLNSGQGHSQSPDPPNAPNVLHAVMPISGSAIDVLVTLQRLCGFSSVIASTLAGELRISLSSQASVQPLYEQTDLPPHLNLAEDLIMQSQAPGEHLSSGDTSGIEIQHSNLKLKLLVHLRVLKTICHLVTVYSINLLCMDLCALKRNVAKKLIGLKVMEIVDKLDALGLVRMCRHHKESSHGCLHYFARQAVWTDRHEPLTQQMCTRINNVSACLDILEMYQEKLLELMSLKNIQVPDASEVNCADDFFGSKLGQEVWSGWADEEDSIRNIFTGSVSQIQNRWAQECKEMMEMASQQLMLVLTGQCRVLAYRLNLFVKDGLEAHLDRCPSNVTISSCLNPVTTFLQKYLDSFSTWLYHDCFYRVLENMWIYIVQDFESVASQLMKAGPSSGPLAHVWMLAVIHFMKFIYNNGKGINRDLLLAQANRVLLQLELYTLSTLHLIALFQSVMDFQSMEGDRLTLEENASKRPPAITHRILKELQSLRKSFSGAELVHWIIKNQNALPADMNLPPEPLTRRTAQIICQNLLDQNFIVELSTESLTRRTTPVSFSQTAEFTPYPELSIERTVSHHYNHEFEEATRFRTFTMASLITLQEFSNSTVSEQSKEQFNNSNTVDATSERLTERTMKREDESKSSKKNLESFNVTLMPLDCAKDTKTNSENTRVLNSVRRGSLQPLPNEGSIHLVDDYNNLTPFDSLIDLTDGGNKFLPDSQTFYLVRQSIFLPSAGCLNQTTRRSEARHSITEQQVNKMKESTENLNLVERCFTHKISPLVILSIMASRKKVDKLAGEFIKQAPPSVQEKLRNIMDEPSVECTSS